MSAKSYQTPDVRVVLLKEDIITTSGGEKGELDFFSFAGWDDGYVQGGIE